MKWDLNISALPFFQGDGGKDETEGWGGGDGKLRGMTIFMIIISSS